MVIFPRMKIPAFAMALVLPLSLLSGCSSTMSARAEKLELGMSKDRVVRTLGRNFTTVAAREDSTASRTEVLRFDDRKSGEMFVFLRDGRLVQWGDIRALQSMAQ